MLKYLIIALMALEFVCGSDIDDIFEGDTPPIGKCNCPDGKSIAKDFKNEVEEMISSLNKSLKRKEEDRGFFGMFVESFQERVKKFNTRHKPIIKQGLASFNKALAEMLESEDQRKESIKARTRSLRYYRKNIDITTQLVDVVLTGNGTIEKFSNSCLPNDGIYKIQIPTYDEPVSGLCQFDLNDGNWLVIQRRMNGLVNFQRNWSEYKYGFGNLSGEFWIGLEKIYALTSHEACELKIIMQDFENKKALAKYDYFAIGDESENYSLKFLGNYMGTTGDSLVKHKNMRFATYDNNIFINNCSIRNTGGWWFHNCLESNLNGEYLKGNVEEIGTGIAWDDFHVKYSLKFVQMMIRPKNKCDYQECFKKK